MNLLDALLTRSIPTSLQGFARMTGGTFPKSLDLDGGYPSDAAVEAIGMVAFEDARRWIRDVFPVVLRSIPYARVDVTDADGQREIRVSTGGWSGVESVVWQVLDHPFMRIHLETERRGGHYVFRVPLEDELIGCEESV